MEKKDFVKLFELMHPGFFDKPYIRELPDSETFDEMILPLAVFDGHIYVKTLDSSITFGFFSGETDELKKAVAQVDEGWVPLFGSGDRVYCGFIDGSIASFCLAFSQRAFFALHLVHTPKMYVLLRSLVNRGVFACIATFVMLVS